MNELSLNQETIKDEMLAFIFEGGNKFLQISSIAGSGKSRIIKEVYKQSEEINSTSCNLSSDFPVDLPELWVTATSNAAVEELIGIGVTRSSTIHKLLGLVVRTNYESGETHLAKGYNYHTNHRGVVIIDESSFVDESLLRILYEQDGLRFILVGDTEQFLSPSSTSELAVDLGSETKCISSNETFRFIDPIFSNYIVELRSYVRDRVIKTIPSKVGSTLLMCSDSHFINQLKESFNNDRNKCKLIAFTNNMVNNYDNNIHTFLGGSTEILSNTNIVLKGKVKLNMGYSLVNEAGNSCTVVSPTQSTGRGADILTKEGISFTCVKAKSGVIGFLIHDISKYKSYLKSLTKSKRWKDYYYLTDYCSIVNYGYSRTGHSSQGSSIDTVFLDLTDLSKLAHVSTRGTIARLIYVAISRAKRKIYIRGQVPDWLLGKY